MALKVYTNNTDHNMHIGGKTILPGESREVDETQIPGFGVSEGDPDPDMPSNPLEELLQGNIASVSAVLITLTADQLDELESLEGNAEKPRKGVLDAINARQLELAQLELG